MSIFHLDYETRSRANLKKVGSYRYAEDESTEIIFAAISKDHGPTYLAVNAKFDPCGLLSQPEAFQLLAEMSEPGNLVYAHNAPFERPISNNRLFLDLGAMPPRAEQWRCTMSMARRAALPQSLDKLGEALNIETKKDSRGKALINKFCIPDKKTGEFRSPATLWSDFVDFGNYCVTDVEAEKCVHQALELFELKGITLQTFLLTTTINDRGLPVNVSALQNAQKILDDVYEDLGLKFIELTGLEPTQREAVKGWLAANGVMMIDMTGETLEEALEQQQALQNAAGTDGDPDEVAALERVIAALQLYIDLNYAAAKKVTSMLACVCSDGRVRGTLTDGGAGTGRWTANLIQPQNFKKATIRDTEMAYQMICDGCSRMELELLFGNALEVIASCIRHFIQWPGGQMIDADYAAVEARIACWLAGQDDALVDYVSGIDRYRKMAGKIYGRPMEEILNPSFEREVGKHTILGCGFGMWYPKFVLTCAEFGVVVSDELANQAVVGYREEHPHVVNAWYAVERAAISAINHPGKVFKPHTQKTNKELNLKFMVVTTANIPFLVMQLPSGRNIVYPHPKLEHDPHFDKLGITFWGQLEGKALWTRCRTYGAKLFENAVQGIAADNIAVGGCAVEADGYEIFTLIHDQLFGPKTDDSDPQEFGRLLTTMPAWANGLPLKADVRFIPYYKGSKLK